MVASLLVKKGSYMDEIIKKLEEEAEKADNKRDDFEEEEEWQEAHWEDGFASGIRYAIQAIKSELKK